MQKYADNSEMLEIAIDKFDTDGLPSLDELMRELVESEPEAQLPMGKSTAANKTIATVAEEYSDNELESKLVYTENALRQAETEKNELEIAIGRIARDFEKYRWRTERERSEHYTFAVISIVRELLPTLDNFERAIGSVNSVEQDQNFSQFVGGVELIYHQTIKTLANIGVQQIKALNEGFDPSFHEAVATEPREDVAPNTIIEEILHGYRIGDKLIRPSMVKVSTAAE